MYEKTDMTENSSGSFEIPQHEPSARNLAKSSQTNTPSNFFSNKQSAEINNQPDFDETNSDENPQTYTRVIRISCCAIS